MAIDFKNSAVQGIDTGFVDVYTCPGTAKSAIIFGMTISNTLSSGSDITVQARIEDLSATTYAHIVAPNTPISPGSSLVVAGGVQKIVLEPGDKIQVASSDTDSADVMISALEIS
jgi:hypothetical protein